MSDQIRLPGLAEVRRRGFEALSGLTIEQVAEEIRKMKVRGEI